MDFSDFYLRRLIFEIRYDQAFVLWDRAGGIARRLTTLWPGLKLAEGVPNHQVLKGQNVDISTGLGASHCILFRPQSFIEHVEQMNKTLAIWVEELEIEKFARIGTRAIYSKDAKSEDEAGAMIAGLALLNIPQSVLRHQTPAHAALVRLNWRDDAVTTQVLIQAEKQTMELDAAREVPGWDEKREVFRINFDVDRATRGDTERSKFRLSDWLEGVRQTIARDANKLLAGK